ncbi:38285_t:CDS:1, partial [Gigaspora margarita]
NNLETIFNRAFNYYLRKNENLIIKSEIRKLTLSSNFYNWILGKFGPDAQITRL